MEIMVLSELNIYGLIVIQEKNLSPISIHVQVIFISEM